MIVISPKKAALIELGILLFLVLLHALGLLTGFSGLFNVGVINSVPSWYSSFNLLISSMLLALIGISNNQQVNRYLYHWLGLAFFFFYLSIDEFAEIHEKLDQLFNLPELGGLFTFKWVILGIPIVLIFFFTYLKFLNYLPKTTKYLLLLAGLIFVMGALGFEMLSALRYDAVGSFNEIIFVLFTTAEEFCEMLGIIVFIYALLDYISVYLQGLKISIGEQTILIK